MLCDSSAPGVKHSRRREDIPPPNANNYVYCKHQRILQASTQRGFARRVSTQSNRKGGAELLETIPGRGT